MAIDKVSPANGPERKTDRVRIPMSSGQQKLAVPEIPGYYLHWFRGEPERIQAALNAFFEFVDESETSQNNLSLGGDAKKSGNTDMGTRVSTLAGSELGQDGQPLRMYLMKLPWHLHEEDLKSQEAKNDNIRQSLNQGTIGTEGVNNSDMKSRYVKESSNMFQPKPIRRT